MIGLELSQSMSAMAKRSVILNGLEDKVEIIQGNLCSCKRIAASRTI